LFESNSTEDPAKAIQRRRITGHKIGSLELDDCCASMFPFGQGNALRIGDSEQNTTQERGRIKTVVPTKIRKRSTAKLANMCYAGMVR